MSRLLKHKEIDFRKYDECIIASSQGTVYAMSWYLDAVFPLWSVCVVGDYDIVMPVPLKRKFGLKYALQPQFCQQLGVFSKKTLTSDSVDEMMKSLPFLYCLNFNHGNIGLIKSKVERPNFVLDLSADYDSLSSGFSYQCRRNIRKASEQKQRLSAIAKDDYLQFLRGNGSQWTNEAQLNILSRLIDNALSVGCAELLSVRNETDEILAAVFFVNWRNRRYYLSPVSSEKGKQWQSMSFLLNKVIEDNSSSSIVLDFEGSAIAGVQNFYRGFGAVDEPYPLVEKNGWIRRLTVGVR